VGRGEELEMNVSDGARQRVLSHIRVATGEYPEDFSKVSATYDALPRTYISRGELSDEALCARMIERLREYDARVIECAPQKVPAAIADELLASGNRTFVAPKGLPTEWMSAGFNWKIDDQLSTEEIEETDGALTAAFCGIADSGTIVLHHSDTEGRRMLSLLPDSHLCILHASQLVETLPEYFGRCQSPPSLATYISGPSATADIEMTRIKGVHGPRFLVVILVRDV
jgi:L-lactate dehydrogenase complex protein LldG